MTFIQELLTALLPTSTMQAIERESRQWVMRCPTCGESQSIWDAGGVRYMAAGKVWRYRRCRKCSHRAWQAIEKESATSGSDEHRASSPT